MAGRRPEAPVEVAVTNDELARVESGLKAGETVVLNPSKTLREGDRQGRRMSVGARSE